MLFQLIAEATECDYKESVEVKKAEELAQKRKRLC